MVMPRVMHKHDDNLEIVLILKGQGQHVIGGRSYLTGGVTSSSIMPVSSTMKVQA
jgi:uncharacterized cupin superfamily protein